MIKPFTKLGGFEWLAYVVGVPTEIIKCEQESEQIEDKHEKQKIVRGAIDQPAAERSDLPRVLQWFTVGIRIVFIRVAHGSMVILAKGFKVPIEASHSRTIGM